MVYGADCHLDVKLLLPVCLVHDRLSSISASCSSLNRPGHSRLGNVNPSARTALALRFMNPLAGTTANKQPCC